MSDMDIFVFEVEVREFNSGNLVAKLPFLGYNVFQVAHLASAYIFGEDTEFKRKSVELGQIRRLYEVGAIVNPYFAMEMDDVETEIDFDGSIPIEFAKKLKDEETISFNCECHEKITVSRMRNFPFVTCPNCDRNIGRNEIVEVGGVWIFQKQEDDDD